MYTKVTQDLIFERKRDFHLITPCCERPNKDGKFVNYKGHSKIYGYCHSCGTSIMPPSLYTDENGSYYHWNSVTHKFEPVLQTTVNNVLQERNNCTTSQNDSLNDSIKPHKFIDFKVVMKTVASRIENNLLQYLHGKYSEDKVNFVKQLYFLGTSKKGGTVFWYVNKEGKAQKAKVSYYTDEGRRTNRFQVPYKNDDGYYSCLFGEHLLKNNKKPIVLVESEKTAIVASIELPNYTWLAYGGINGLTDKKLKILEGENVIIIPDMSEKAVSIMNYKLSYFETIEVNVKIWDMTQGKTDEQLKKEGLYNCDVEDVFRKSGAIQ